MDEHQCSVLFFECSPPRQTNSVLSLKLSFKKAVPQIKYDHTFKSTDFNWRRWTSNDYFTGKLVAPQGFMKGATRKEREDEKEKQEEIEKENEKEKGNKTEREREREIEEEEEEKEEKAKEKEKEKNIKRTRKKKRKRDYCFVKKHGLPFF